MEEAVQWRGIKDSIVPDERRNDCDSDSDSDSDSDDSDSDHEVLPSWLLTVVKEVGEQLKV